MKLDFYDYQPAMGALAEHSCLSEDSHLHKWRLFPITSHYKTSRASDKMETFKKSVSINLFYQIKHILNKVAIIFFVWFSLFGQSFMESLKSCSLNFVYITNVTGIFHIIYIV